MCVIPLAAVVGEGRRGGWAAFPSALAVSDVGGRNDTCALKGSLGALPSESPCLYNSRSVAALMRAVARGSSELG
jgi:hypothetical protein